MQNLSEKGFEGASSNLHTSRVKLAFKGHFKDGPEDGLFLDQTQHALEESELSQESAGEEFESSSEQIFHRDCFIAYESALQKRLSKLVNYL